jgi:diguanylate cyclase (GGDEF)-like protein/PAS domain S-box-containing protein
MNTARVLIVEDEKIIALDLRKRLESFGFDIVGTATTGPDAIELTGTLRPDIILMDIMLSEEMDGIEAATSIKERYGVPVIFLTAYADEKTLERAREAEPFGYILKPFKERELYSTINIALYKSSIDKHILRQERLFSAILDSVADALIATDETGRIRFMNPVAETMTAWTEEEARHKYLSEILHFIDVQTELPVAVPGIESLHKNGAYHFDGVSVQNRMGAQIHVEGIMTAIRNQDGKIDGQVMAFHDISEYKKMSDQIVYQASHDSMTGLLNRDEFIAKLEEIIHNTKENTHGYIYIDIDQFKVVNDVCGHLAGDELIRQVSRSFADILPGPPPIGRLGGDEFGIILQDTDLEESRTTAEAVLNHMRRKFIWQKHLFNITASIGVVPVTTEARDVYRVIAAADDACYLAKESGGNTIRVYESSSQVFLKRRGEMNWISRLTRAIDENRFVLFSQAIASLDGLNPPKQEILLRLRDINDENTDETLISPAEFIPAAEKYQLMPQVDRWVIRETLAYVKRSLNQTGVSEKFCINISGASIADDTFLDYVLQIFRDIGVGPEHFTFEITETTAIENLTRALNVIQTLQDEGATFALDDFGNGFSSFSYLKNLRFDFLKIDGSFVKGIDTDPIHRALVEAVNNMGHVMGMKTIAEFVSTEEIRRTLVEIGVDYAQGYSIAKPSRLE